jgi:glycosyltransferase involved in cell wall biosynthesis
LILRHVLLIKGNYDRAGGGETMVATQLAAMDPMRYAVTLAVLQKPGLSGSSLLRDAAPHVPREEIFWAGLMGAGRAARRLRAIIEQQKIDLLHTHDMRANLAAYLVNRRRRVPWVAHVHGWLGQTHTAKYRMYEAVDRWLIRRADLVIVGSQATRAEAESAGAKRVAVVPNAVPIPEQAMSPSDVQNVRNELGCRNGEVLVGVVGRVHPGKGQSYLLRAVAAARRAGVAVRAVIVGEGPDLQTCQLLVKELKIELDVTFTGFAADAMRYLSAMDVVVVPSLKESLPLTALEAMVRGRPVIASAVGDLPTVIEDGKTGLLVPPGDVPALRAAIERLAGDPTSRDQIGENGRQHAIDNYSAAVMTRRIQDLYDQVLGEARG